MAKDKTTKVVNKGMGGFAYFLTIIGAAVYFVQNSDGFWAFILAILKALVWPAFAVHRAFELMGL